MNTNLVWTTDLKNRILGGLKPELDPFDSSRFYISDGWGSSIPSMKLRRFSLVDGKELDSFPIKNSVRCLYFHPDQQKLFAVSDSKIFQLDRGDLSLIHKMDKGIMKYADYISSNDSDTLLLMNSNADYLFIYNFVTGAGSKKKLKSCRGLSKEKEGMFLVFCPKLESIQLFDLKSSKIKELLNVGLFYKAYKSRSGHFYLQKGTWVEATSNTYERIDPLSQLEVYTLNDSCPKQSFTFDFYFDTFVVSDNEELLYLSSNHQLWVYSMSTKAIVKKIQLDEKERIAQVFEASGLFLSFDYSDPRKLTCWKL